MIYVDMDGVFVDWYKAAAELVNTVGYKNEDEWPNWTRGIDFVDQRVLDLRAKYPDGVTEQDMIYERVIVDSPLRSLIKHLLQHIYSEYWWATLPQTSKMWDIMEAVSTSESPWCLLTKPISREPLCNEGCTLGKLIWCRCTLGLMAIIIDRDKGKYGQPGDILIDDELSNIDKFKANGGYGIHIKDLETLTVEYLKAEIKKGLGGKA